MVMLVPLKTEARSTLSPTQWRAEGAIRPTFQVSLHNDSNNPHHQEFLVRMMGRVEKAASLTQHGSITFSHRQQRIVVRSPEPRIERRPTLILRAILFCSCSADLYDPQPNYKRIHNDRNVINRPALFIVKIAKMNVSFPLTLNYWDRTRFTNPRPEACVGYRPEGAVRADELGCC